MFASDASSLKKRFIQLKEQIIYGLIGKRTGARSSVFVGASFALWDTKPDSGLKVSVGYDDP